MGESIQISINANTNVGIGIDQYQCNDSDALNLCLDIAFVYIDDCAYTTAELPIKLKQNVFCFTSSYEMITTIISSRKKTEMESKQAALY